MTALSTETRVPVLALDAPPAGQAWKVARPRIALYKPWIASMDEGWTRFLLERYGFDFVNLSNQEIRGGGLAQKIDVLLLPDVEESIIKDGKPAEEVQAWHTPLPPDYAGGLGDEGGGRIKEWVLKGGTILAMNASSAYAIRLLDLPVSNVLDKVRKEDFNCPGSMLRIRMETSHPLAYGMRAEEAAFFVDSPAFATRVPDARFDRRAVASYPPEEKDILLSGYLKGGQRLERRAAVVEVSVGKGRAILIGFKPQNRAQPHRTFKLLWNALYLGGLEPVELP